MITKNDISRLKEISTEYFLNKNEKYPPIVKMGEWLEYFTREISKLNDRIKNLEEEIAILKGTPEKTASNASESQHKVGVHDQSQGHKILSPETIGKIRIAFGCNITQMAKILNVSPKYYTSVERGNAIPSLALQAQLLRLQYITATQRREILQQHGFFHTTARKIAPLPIPHLPETPDIRISIAELHEIKDKLNISYSQLAELIGTTQSQVSNWFCGISQPTEEYCQRLRMLTPKDVKKLPQRLFPLKSPPQPPLQSKEILEVLQQLCWTVPQLAACLHVPEYKVRHWLSGHSAPTTKQANRVKDLMGSISKREYEKRLFTIDEFRELKEKLEYSDYHLAILLGMPFQKVHNWSCGQTAPSQEESVKLRDIYSRVILGTFVDSTHLPRIPPEKINEIRERQRLRRKDLIRILGIQSNTFERWMRGKRGPTPQENEKLWILWEKPAAVKPITLSANEVLELRKSRNLTQKRFGELIGEKRNKISRIELGLVKVSCEIDRKIRNVFDLPQA